MDNSPLLPEEYSIREMSEAEFSPAYKEHRIRIFYDNGTTFLFYPRLAKEEAKSLDNLEEAFANCSLFTLRLGVSFRDQFCGWTIGGQQADGVFYMRNSAIFPEHRRKGLYSALLDMTLQIARNKGFQAVRSRHKATNNEVLIPKLKAGFKITGFEISDIFGTLVHLTLFLNPLREQVLDYRVGYKPSDEVKKALGL